MHLGKNRGNDNEDQDVNLIFLVAFPLLFMLDKVAPSDKATKEC